MCVCVGVCVCVFYCKHVDQIKGHLFFHCTGNNFKLNENDSRKKKMAQDFYFSALSKFKPCPQTYTHTPTTGTECICMWICMWVWRAARGERVCVCVSRFIQKWKTPTYRFTYICTHRLRARCAPHTHTHAGLCCKSAQWKCRCSSSNFSTDFVGRCPVVSGGELSIVTDETQ